MAERKVTKEEELYGRFLVVSTNWDNEQWYWWFGDAMEKCLKEEWEELDWAKKIVDMASRREHDAKEADTIREEYLKKAPVMGPHMPG